MVTNPVSLPEDSAFLLSPLALGGDKGREPAGERAEIPVRQGPASPQPTPVWFGFVYSSQVSCLLTLSRVPCGLTAEGKGRFMLVRWGWGLGSRMNPTRKSPFWVAIGLTRNNWLGFCS